MGQLYNINLLNNFAKSKKIAIKDINNNSINPTKLTRPLYDQNDQHKFLTSVFDTLS